MSITADLPRSIERPTQMRYLVLAALLVVTSINYLQRNAIGPAEVEVRESLGLTKQHTGTLMLGFFAGYALFQVPSGWLAQRWGARRALSFYTAAWSSMMVLTACGQGFLDTLSYRFLLGVFQAGIFPCASLVLANWYPPSQRGLATALMNSFMLIGAMICTIQTGFLLSFLDWRWIFALYGLPGLVWAGWFLWWFRDSPREAGVNAAELEIIREGRPPDAPVSPAKREATPWQAILISLPLWILCAQQGLRAGAARLYDNWLPTYFREVRGGNALTAGLLTSLPLAAGVVGGVVGGLLSDFVLQRTQSRSAGRKGVALASLFVGPLCFFIAYPIANVWVATVVFSAGVFITMFSAPCAFALTMDMAGKNLGVVFGIVNMAGNLGSAAFVQLVPFVQKRQGWTAALAVFACLHLTAGLCWLLLDPNVIIGEPAPARQPEQVS